jgi:GAF domain-containing protein
LSGKKLSTLADPENILAELVTAIANTLEVDRCFLYVRDPQTRLGRPAFCNCRNPQVTDVSSNQWKVETELEAEDPLFAAALNCQAAVYVEDLETASPKVVNREFEAREFGHRALIHAHLCAEGKLWGILQPCVFERPRQWTTKNREFMETMVIQMTPLVQQYVQKNISGVGK